MACFRHGLAFEGIFVAIFVSLWGSILWMLVDAIPLAMSLIKGCFLH